jgi:diaminohydroxyphosphoribosylaminopyrimidine deaminase / 5-amino-6-(5-phosphoribosylamino)uracil reductase
MPVSDSASMPAAVDPPTAQAVWGALLTAARWSREEAAPEEGSYGADAAAGLRVVPDDSPLGLMKWQRQGGWIPAANAPPAAQALLDLYLTICNVTAQSPLTVGHLGQGLDGYIATSSGDSNYVTGADNILHLHRMRALCDVVMVGAGTVAADDPQLTARRADGSHPVRVILDPRRRLAHTHSVFTDGQAQTLLVCDEARVAESAERIGAAEVVGVPMGADGLDLTALLRALHDRQLFAIFVEGGGRTVSTFLERGLLDRLQIAIAPLLTGAGRPGIRLSARQHIAECLRLSHRVFAMGDDVLFDCDLRRAVDASGAQSAVTGRLRRIV